MLPQLHKNAVDIGSRQKSEVPRGRKRIGSHELKTDCKHRSTHQIAADILMPSPNGHAANMVTIEQEGHESELIQHGQSNEENTTVGKHVEEQKELVLK
jgi:hypothetical protein